MIKLNWWIKTLIHSRFHVEEFLKSHSVLIRHHWRCQLCNNPLLERMKLIEMTWCKTAVFPLLSQWRYCSLALIHRNDQWCLINRTPFEITGSYWTFHWNLSVFFVLTKYLQWSTLCRSPVTFIRWFVCPWVAMDQTPPWWRHQMETFSALLVLCEGNSLITGEFPPQRPVTRSFDVFFDLRLNKRLSKPSRRWWFETSSRSIWRHWSAMDQTLPLSPFRQWCWVEFHLASIMAEHGKWRVMACQLAAWNCFSVVLITYNEKHWS